VTALRLRAAPARFWDGRLVPESLMMEGSRRYALDPTTFL
jgi:hypothetical protein